MLVGSAEIVVRAITSKIDSDIQKGFSGVSRTGERAGQTMAQKFTQGFNKGIPNNLGSQLANGLRQLSPQAEGARLSFEKLFRTSFFVNTGLSAIVGGISSVIGGLGALIGSAGGAAASITVLGNAFFAFVSSLGVAKLALSGVGKALSALNKSSGGGGSASAVAADKAQAAADKALESAEKSLAKTIQQNRENIVDANNAVRDAQLALNQAFKEGQDQIKQTGFDAEDAALQEKQASLDLQDARLALAKVQDLPPNSRARQEAELAYQEADLNLRKAMDASQQLNAEQDQLAKTGVKGTDAVISATNALAQAQANKSKVVRDAAQAEADAQDNLADATKNAQTAGDSGGGGGGTDPFAGLNQAQIDFVNFIQSLKPQFEQLKLIAANSFLPPLQQAITILSTQAFDTVARGVGVLGAALGQATISLASAIVQGRNLAALTTIFDSSGRLIQTFGLALGNLFGIVVQLLAAAAPTAEKFFTFVNAQFGIFNDYLARVTADGTLGAFFVRSGEIAAQFGKVFANLFGGLGAIIRANFAPGSGGDIMLQWLITVTSGFRNLDDTVGKAAGLRKYFQDVATNAKAVLGSIGELIHVLGTLGANPAIGQTFDILKTGAPIIGQIAAAGVAAGPALARLVVNVLRIFEAFADGPQAIAFFNTLNFVAEKVADFFQSKVVQSILAVIAPIQGVAEAIGLLLVGVGIAFKIVTGFAIFFAEGLSKVTEALKFLAANPILLILGLLAAAFIYLYNTNQAFADQINGIVATVLPQLQAAVAPLLTAFSGLATTLAGVLGPVLQSLAPLFVSYVTYLANLVTAIVPLISTLLTGLIPVIGTLVTALGTTLIAIMPSVNLLFQALSGVLITVLQAVAPLIPVFVSLITTLVGALVPVLPILATAFNDIITAISPLITLLGGILGKAISDLLTKITPLSAVLLSGLAPALTGILGAVLPLISALITQFVPVIESILKAVSPLITVLLSALLPVFNAIIQAVLPVIDILIKALMPIFKVIIDAITPLINVLVAILVPAFQLLSAILTPIIQLLAAILVPVIQLVGGVLQFLVGIITGIVVGAFQLVGGIIQGLNIIFVGFQIGLQAVSDFIADTFTNISNFISGALTNIGNFFTTVFTNIGNFVKTVWTGYFNIVSGAVNNVVNFITGAFNGVSGFITSIFGTISSTFTSVWDGIASTIKSIINGIIATVQGLINGIIDGINGIIGAVQGLPSIPGVPKPSKLSHISIPRLADGGIIPATPGGRLITVAEAGKPERVEPLDANGLSKRDLALINTLTGGAAGGNTFNITQLPGESAQDLADRIAKILAFRQRKGGVV